MGGYITITQHPLSSFRRHSPLSFLTHTAPCSTRYRTLSRHVTHSSQQLVTLGHVVVTGRAADAGPVVVVLAACGALPMRCGSGAGRPATHSAARSPGPWRHSPGDPHPPPPPTPPAAQAPAKLQQGEVGEPGPTSRCSSFVCLSVCRRRLPGLARPPIPRQEQSSIREPLVKREKPFSACCIAAAVWCGLACRGV